MGKKKGLSANLKREKMGNYNPGNWRPQRDLNSRRRRERPVSWARLDDGDVLGFLT